MCALDESLLGPSGHLWAGPARMQGLVLGNLKLPLLCNCAGPTPTQGTRPLSTSSINMHGGEDERLTSGDCQWHSCRENPATQWDGDREAHTKHQINLGAGSKAAVSKTTL